jgi:hypothetical protein
VIVAAGALTVPAIPAGAHPSDPSVRPVIDAVDPAVPGVTVQLAASVTAQLVVSNPTPTPVSVLDVNDEPFLRIGPEGVSANKSSPWWYLTNSPNGDATTPAMLTPARRLGGSRFRSSRPGAGSSTACIRRRGAPRPT